MPSGERASGESHLIWGWKLSLKYGSHKSAGPESSRAVPPAPQEDRAGWGLSCQAPIAKSNLEDK